MINKKHLLIVIKIYTLLLILFFLPSTYAQSDIKHMRDSIYQLIPTLKGEEQIKAYDRIYNLMDFNMPPEEELNFLQEYLAAAQKYGDKASSNQVIMHAAILNFYYNQNRKEDFIRTFPEHISYIKQHNVEHMLILWIFKTDFYISDEQYDEAIKETEDMRAAIADQNDPYLLGMVNCQIGVIYYRQGHDKQAIPLLIESIELMKKNLPFDRAMFYNAYRFLVKALFKEKRIDEVLHYNKEYEAFLVKEEAEELLPDGTPENSFRLIIYKYYCYLQYANAYLEKNDFDKAEAYIAKSEQFWDRIAEDMKGNLFQTKSLLYAKQGNYLQAAQQVQNVIDVLKLDNRTVSQASRSDYYKQKADYLVKAGHYKEAAPLYDTAYTQLTVNNHTEFEKRLTDIRTRYEVDRLEAEKLRIRNYLILALGSLTIILLMFVLAVIFYRNKRKAYKDLVRRSQDWAGIVVSEKVVEPDDDKITVAETIDVEDVSTTEDADKVIMNSIEKIMSGEKLYKNADLTLDSLSKEIEMNRYYVSSALNRCAGKHFNAFINEYRIKEAVRLLSEPQYAHLSIEGIAFESGFNSRQSFHQSFTKIIGLSPSVFRQNAKN